MMVHRISFNGGVGVPFYFNERSEKVTETELERLTKVDDRARSNTRRIEGIEERLDNTEKLITSVAIIAEKQNKMESDVTEMKCDVKHLLEKPAKKWEAVTDKVVLIIITALVGFCLANIGL